MVHISHALGAQDLNMMHATYMRSTRGKLKVLIESSTIVLEPFFCTDIVKSSTPVFNLWLHFQFLGITTIAHIT